MAERTDTHLTERHTYDEVDLKVASLIYRAARRAYGYVPADERPERIAEELADEE